MTSLTGTSDLLGDWLHAPGLPMLKGAQVCVEVGGRDLHLVVGDAGTGRPMTTDTVFRVYCAIKPIAALAVAQLVDNGDVELDTTLDVLVGDDVNPVPQATLRQLLSHTAGLHCTSTLEMELLTPLEREQRLAEVRPPDGWSLGIDAGYSEYAGWQLVGRVLQAVTGQPLREHLRASVLDPLGMKSTWIGMTTTEYEHNANRLGLNWALRGAKSMPLLLEHTQRWCTEVNSASGGYTTASDLARCYSRVVARLNGHADPALPTTATLQAFCSPARPRCYDVVLERECEYGLGFMVDLSDHFFGNLCSERSFGHTGLAGCSFAFGDPSYDLAGAVILNGIVEGSPSRLRRDELVHSIYRDLGIGRDEPCHVAMKEP